MSAIFLWYVKISMAIFKKLQTVVTVYMVNMVTVRETVKETLYLSLLLKRYHEKKNNRSTNIRTLSSRFRNLERESKCHSSSYMIWSEPWLYTISSIHQTRGCFRKHTINTENSSPRYSMYPKKSVGISDIE